MIIGKGRVLIKRIREFFKINGFLSIVAYIVTTILAIIVFAIIKESFGPSVTIVLALCVFIFINTLDVKRGRISIKEVLNENMFILMLAFLFLVILLLYIRFSNV